ncbi:SRPBCC domain-containing protein [Burkholderia alba]|uniref:SRPBCC domain-containing protein n=1 Tax=Burkholderia alba TaxID=2683677 RepID=UPI002B058E9A|nr:SRPBCC domain-containing protein [Burkholderia alba]
MLSTPERVFDALTRAEPTKAYGVRHCGVSDWRIGSGWAHRNYDAAAKVGRVGEGLENDPPRRRVITWRAKEGGETSRVTFGVAPSLDGAARLTVTHEERVPGSETERGIRKGWPVVVPSLKSPLETGRALPMTARHRAREATRHTG